MTDSVSRSSERIFVLNNRSDSKKIEHSEILGSAAKMDLVSVSSFRAHSHPGNELIVTRQLGMRRAAPASSNITASLDIEGGKSSVKETSQLKPLLEIKIRRCILLIYYLLSAAYKTGCPSLLDQTNAQFVVGYDGLEGLHSCLTPNAHIFSHPAEIVKGLKDFTEVFLQKNLAAIEEIKMLSKAGGNIPLDEEVIITIKFLLFNLNLNDVLTLLDQNSFEYTEISLLIEKINGSLNLLRKELVSSKTSNDCIPNELERIFKSENLQNWLNHHAVLGSLEHLEQDLKNLSESFKKIDVSHTHLREGESLLDNTVMQLNMNSGDVLPSLLNYFDGDVIESALRWRNIYQMNRAAAGDDVFDLLKYMIDHLKFLISNTDQYLEEQKNQVALLVKIEEEWKKIETELQKDLRSVIESPDATFSAKLQELKVNFKKLLNILIDLKLIELKLLEYKKNKKNAGELNIVKNEKGLSEALDTLNACQKGGLTYSEEDLKKEQPIIASIQSFIEKKISSFKRLFPRVAKFNPNSSMKEGDFWNSFINASDRDILFDQMFPFFNSATVDKRLVRFVKELSVEIESAQLENKRQFETTSQQLFIQLNDALEDPTAAVSFLKNISHRIKAGQDPHAIQLVLLRIMHQSIIEFCKNSEMKYLFDYGQSRLHLDPGRYFYLSNHEMTYPQLKLAQTDSLPDVSELGPFAAIFQLPQQLDAVTLTDCIQKAENHLAATHAPPLEAALVGNVRCYIARLKLSLQLYNQELTFSKGKLSESFRAVFNFENIRNGVFFKTVGLHTPVLPSFYELGGEYAPLFENLNKIDKLNNAEKLIEETISKASALLSEQACGKTAFVPHAVQAYIVRLKLGLRIFRFLQSVRQDPSFKSLHTSADKLMQQFTFRNIQQGIFFQSFQSFFFPTPALVLVDENNCLVMDERYLEGAKSSSTNPQGKKTEIDVVAGLMNLFVKFCEAEEGLIAKTVFKQTGQWSTAVNHLKKDDLKSRNVHSTVELNENLTLLKDQVVPVYSEILKTEFSGKELAGELFETIITEFDNSQLNQPVERFLFRQTLHRLGPEFIFQWFTSAVLGRKVEHVHNPMPLQSLANAIPEGNAFPLEFLVTFEKQSDSGEKICKIKLLDTGVSIESERLVKIAESVFEDACALSTKMNDWSAPKEFTAQVIVKPFSQK